MNMNFKEWYYMITEVGTGSNCVAVFARPIFGSELVQRTWPQMVGSDFKPFEDDDKKKKKSRMELI